MSRRVWIGWFLVEASGDLRRKGRSDFIVVVLCLTHTHTHTAAGGAKRRKLASNDKGGWLEMCHVMSHTICTTDSVN